MNKRLSSIDCFRTVAILMILVLHAPIPGVYAGGIPSAFARIGVPFFFMTSGYFTYVKNATEQKEKAKKRVVRLIFLLLGSNFLFLLWEIIKCVIAGDSITRVWKFFISPAFLLFNFRIGGHLWFLRALVYLTAALYFLSGVKRKTLVFCILPVSLLFVDLIVCKYSIYLFSKPLLPLHIYEPLTKYIGCALPFFSLGYFIRYQKARLPESELLPLHRAGLNFLLVAALLLYLAEFMFFQMRQCDVKVCNYAFTTVSTIVVFYWLLAHGGMGKASLVEKIGRDYSFLIYILHPIVAQSLEKITFVHNGGIGVRYINIFVLFGLSLLVSYISKRVLDKFNVKIN